MVICLVSSKNSGKRKKKGEKGHRDLFCERVLLWGEIREKEKREK